MAVHIKIEEIENLLIQRYKEVQKQLNSGDYFLMPKTNATAPKRV